jgi:hypothetical protein
VEEFEHPTAGESLDEQGAFGEGEGEEVVELVDQAGALADGGLEPSGDLAEQAPFDGQRRGGCGPLGAGEASGGAGLDGVGLEGAEECGAVVLVALGVAAGDGEDGIGDGRSGFMR